MQNPDIIPIEFDDECGGRVVVGRFSDLTGIATLSHDPLATVHVAGRKTTKRRGSRK
jgi:hypothetical protein